MCLNFLIFVPFIYSDHLFAGQHLDDGLHSRIVCEATPSSNHCILHCFNHPVKALPCDIKSNKSSLCYTILLGKKFSFFMIGIGYFKYVVGIQQLTDQSIKSVIK